MLNDRKGKRELCNSVSLTVPVPSFLFSIKIIKVRTFPALFKGHSGVSLALYNEGRSPHFATRCSSVIFLTLYSTIHVKQRGNASMLSLFPPVINETAHRHFPFVPLPPPSSSVNRYYGDNYSQQACANKKQ